MPHIYASVTRVSIGSDNGLAPIRCQAIILINTVLLIGPLGTNSSEILITIQTFHSQNAFENIVCEIAAILSRGGWVNPSGAETLHSMRNILITYMLMPWLLASHYCDIIMGARASQITSLTIVYSAVYSGADQRKHQSSVSQAFVRGIHRRLVNSPHKGPMTRKMFPFDNVIIARTPVAIVLALYDKCTIHRRKSLSGHVILTIFST